MSDRTSTSSPTLVGEAVSVPDQGTERPAVAHVLAENREEFLGFLARRVGSRELADELLQEAFVSGLSRAGSLRDDESAVAWFYRLLRNRLVDHFRAAARDKRREAPDEAAENLAMEDDDGLHRQVCACVGKTLNAVSSDYAEVLRAVDLEGEDVEAFAQRAGIAIGNARVRLHRARRSMRQRLEQMCGATRAEAFIDCGCSSDC